MSARLPTYFMRGVGWDRQPFSPHHEQGGSCDSQHRADETNAWRPDEKTSARRADPGQGMTRKRLVPKQRPHRSFWKGPEH